MPRSYFTKKSLTFFRQLEKNNSREWFTPRKGEFEEHVRRPMVELVTDLCGDLRKFAVDLVPAEPARAIYRIYRDTRFSKDKSPYKLHIAAHFQHGQLPKNRAAGLYFAISHKSVDIGGGIYMPGPEELKISRETISRSLPRFRKLVEDRKLVRAYGPLQGDAVKRVPSGFSPDDPASEFLKMKQWYFYIELPAAEATRPTLRKTLVDCFKLAEPFVRFFNDAIVAALHEEDDRPRRPEPMF
jgi:uncharacterized protein (TIGR02453 family)